MKVEILDRKKYLEDVLYFKYIMGSFTNVRLEGWTEHEA